MWRAGSTGKLICPISPARTAGSTLLRQPCCGCGVAVCWCSQCLHSSCGVKNGTACYHLIRYDAPALVRDTMPRRTAACKCPLDVSSHKLRFRRERPGRGGAGFLDVRTYAAGPPRGVGRPQTVLVRLQHRKRQAPLLQSGRAFQKRVSGRLIRATCSAIGSTERGWRSATWRVGSPSGCQTPPL